MKIIYKVGDALATDCAFIVQGCNAQGVMGSGIAKSIRVLYPKVYDEYHSFHQKHGLNLGAIIPVQVAATNYNGHMVDERYILNGITQEYFGRDPNIVYVDYDAISRVFDGINLILDVGIERSFAKTHGSFTDDFPNVALPLIGAGLANGLWSEIAQRIEAESRTYQPIVYVENQEKLDGLWTPTPTNSKSYTS